MVKSFNITNSAYQDAQRNFSLSCTQKILTRCQYIHDKMVDFEDMTQDGPLFCKQSECYHVFGDDLSNRKQGIELNACLQNDANLDLCENGQNQREKAFQNLGMVKGRTYLIPPKLEFYKVERMIYAQNKAYDMGLSKDDAYAIVYQLNVENGAWSEDRMGDYWCKSSTGGEDYCANFGKYGRIVTSQLYPCSFGLVQFNSCANFGVPSDQYYAKHPEWHDYRFQIDQLVTFLTAKKQAYDGDFQKAQVDWNYPQASKNNFYKTVPYYEKLQVMKQRFSNSQDELGATEVSF